MSEQNTPASLAEAIHGQGAESIPAEASEHDPSFVPSGTKVNDVFDLYANIMPNSPWTTYLRRVQEIFNLLAEGATLLDTLPSGRLQTLIAVPQSDDITEQEAKNIRQWNQGITRLIEGMSLMRPVPKPDVEPAEVTP